MLNKNNRPSFHVNPFQCLALEVNSGGLGYCVLTSIPVATYPCYWCDRWRWNRPKLEHFYGDTIWSLTRILYLHNLPKRGDCLSRVLWTDILNVAHGHLRMQFEQVFHWLPSNQAMRGQGMVAIEIKLDSCVLIFLKSNNQNSSSSVIHAKKPVKVNAAGEPRLFVRPYWKWMKYDLNVQRTNRPHSIL